MNISLKPKETSLIQVEIALSNSNNKDLSPIYDSFSNKSMRNQIKYENTKKRPLHEPLLTYKPQNDHDELTLIKLKEKVRQKINQHRIPLEELSARLGVNLQTGLSTKAALQRLKEEGFNQLPRKYNQSCWVKYLYELKNWFTVILWIASTLCFAVYLENRQDNQFILGVGCFLIVLTILTAIFTFTLTPRSPESEKHLIPPSSKVLRDGKIVQIPWKEIVLGDIVEFIAGEAFPADIRIIRSLQIKVSNFAITKKYEHLKRSIECHNEHPFQAQNLAFAGTLCAEGRGRGIVIQIGNQTVIALKNNLTSSDAAQTSLLKQSLNRFIVIMSIIALILTVVMAISMKALNFSLYSCLMICIGILLASVPEGLLLIYALIFIITANSLFKKNLLIKQLKIIEEVSKLSCICFDKDDLLYEKNQDGNYCFKGEVLGSIEKCRVEGIKIIFITRDQSRESQTFGKAIGVLTMKTNLELEQQGLNALQAIQKANSIVIDDKMIKTAYEDGKQAGDLCLEGWCTKKQVVFAHTLPIQKIDIVKACRRMGYGVSVTADGYFDSILCKQADIGISMENSGCDVSKNAADVILLDDSFTTLVDGIERCRSSLRNIEKMTLYLLTSNLAEICPFVMLVIFQIPPPLSISFVLCISLGTDLYAEISFAFQEAEIGITTKTQSSFSVQLLIQSYSFSGIFATCAGIFSYNLIMSCYGFPFDIYFELLGKNAYIPLSGIEFNNYLGNPESTFKLDAPYLGYIASSGNSTYYDGICSISRFGKHQNYPNWFTITNNKSLLNCCSNFTQNNYCPQFNWPPYSQLVQTISPISGVEVAYTTQAVFYAQSGYFSAIVMIQWSNLFACKSRQISFIYTKPNYHMFGSMVVSACILIVLLYVPGINSAFGGRPLPFFMLIVPGAGFSTFFLLWSELRKKILCK